jgi:hypothetical protein
MYQILRERERESSLSHPACKAHAPHLLPSVAWLSMPYVCLHIIPQNDFRRGGGLLNLKCVFSRSTTFVWNIFHYDKIYHKCTHIGLHVQCRYSGRILIKLEFSGQIFEKYSNIKFHENPSSGSRVAPCRRTDGRDETCSCFSQFCERSYTNQLVNAVYSNNRCLFPDPHKTHNLNYI